MHYGKAKIISLTAQCLLNHVSKGLDEAVFPTKLSMGDGLSKSIFGNLQVPAYHVFAKALH